MTDAEKMWEGERLWNQQKASQTIISEKSESEKQEDRILTFERKQQEIELKRQATQMAENDFRECLKTDFLQVNPMPQNRISIDSIRSYVIQY